MNSKVIFPAFHALTHWRLIEFISDVHLTPSEPETASVWRDYFNQTQADAVFLLGDIFEVWIGDDAALDATSFEAQNLEFIKSLRQNRGIDLYWICGNRDFLFGENALKQSAMNALNDPTILIFQNERYLLSHGDALCLSDVQYQAFRKQVRDEHWQRQFLEQPLTKRRDLARLMRQESQVHQKQYAENHSNKDLSKNLKSNINTNLNNDLNNNNIDNNQNYFDLDENEVKKWLHLSSAKTFIHGHTHQPATHYLENNLKREVLSDWDACAKPPRAQVLQLDQNGLRRIDLI